MSKKLDLSYYSDYEKLEWLVDALGEYQAVEAVFEETGKSAELLNAMVAEFEHGVDEAERCYGDSLTWFLEGSSASDAVMWLAEHNEFCVKYLIDDLIRAKGLDTDEGAADGFDSNEAWLRWRNGA